MRRLLVRPVPPRAGSPGTSECQVVHRLSLVLCAYGGHGGLMPMPRGCSDPCPDDRPRRRALSVQAKTWLGLVLRRSSWRFARPGPPAVRRLEPEDLHLLGVRRLLVGELLPCSDLSLNGQPISLSCLPTGEPAKMAVMNANTASASVAIAVRMVAPSRDMREA